MVFRFRLACSFCGKSAAQVQKLVAGRRAYICDRCAEETMRLMNASSTPPREAAGLLRRLIARLTRRTPRSTAMLSYR